MTHGLFPVNAAPAAGPDPAPLLALLAQLGCPRGLVSLLAELGGATLTADARRYLEGPLVVHAAGGWENDLPDWMPAQVRAERVDIVLGGAAWIVGPTEIAAVMYAATCAAPLAHGYAELYLWGTVHAMVRHSGRSAADLWAMLGGQPVTDRDVCERGGRLWHLYQPLAETIRRRVIAHCKPLEPGMGRRPPDTAPPPTPARQPEGHGQPPAPIPTIPTDLFAFLTP
ncbi:hypothetical protein ACIU1J_32165 [Azospirillum doebereinerae]|uniref:hypothetical protein n=1 Tax=Azospirillum doebereinerae TaxID=92933 RepID=UPI001EE551E6|nr:hypothetical protein [Azospirillum doebereinerae]MCG5238404.1 hypothetical protein [Azospirillum doebereinerae]